MDSFVRKMIKKFVKKLGAMFAPRLTMEVLSARSQKLIMKIERESGCLSLSRDFINKNGRAVLRGPFAGMHYPEDIAIQRNLVHRLVGSYERELHPWIEEIILNKYVMLIDVGTADGFYAVGFAMRMPSTKIVGFDTDPWARSATKELVQENRIGNVDVKSMCTPVWVQRNVPPNSLIFSDCEGYEAVLFDPKIAPNLMACDMVIELHERAAPGVEDTIRARFGATHNLRTITYLDHDPAEFPELEMISQHMRAAVISEGRGGPQNVLFLTRKS